MCCWRCDRWERCELHGYEELCGGMSSDEKAGCLEDVVVGEVDLCGFIEWWGCTLLSTKGSTVGY